MQKLPLYGKDGRGRVALVDDEHFERLSRYRYYVDPGGYPYRVSYGRRRKLHQDVLEPIEGLEIDHIDGDTLNATRINLRYTTRELQNRNVGPKGRLPYKGVRPCGRASKRFFASITLGGEDKYIGTFETVEDGARAYDTYAEYCLGNRAWLNFPNERRLTFEEVERLRVGKRSASRSLYEKEFELMRKQYMRTAFALSDIERAVAKHERQMTQSDEDLPLAA